MRKSRANLTQARAEYLRKFRASPAYQQALKAKQDDEMAWAGGTDAYVDHVVNKALDDMNKPRSRLQKLKRLNEDGGASAEADRIIAEEFAKVGLPPPPKRLTDGR